MTILTDEMIEKAAAAAYKHAHGTDDWASQDEWLRLGYIEEARAALSTILPDVVEECAKAAKKPRPLDAGQDMLANEIIAAIRSLTKENGNG